MIDRWNGIIGVAAVCSLLAAGCGRDGSSGGGTSQSGATQPPLTTSVPTQNLDAIVEQFNRGVALMDRFETGKAIEAFERVGELAPQWLTGRLNLAIALLNAPTDANLARAEKLFNQVIDAAPDTAHAHYALGMLLLYVGRHDEAKPHFERVLTIDPDDADAHYQMGVLLAVSDAAAARAHLEKTLMVVPHHASACYRLQAIVRAAGEAERAQQLLDRFQQLEASGAGVFAGMKYGEMGRYAEVVRTFGDGEAAVVGTMELTFENVAEVVGLTAGSAPQNAGQFGPGAAVADVDGSGSLDIYLPGIGQDGSGVLYLQAAERTFTPFADSGIDGQGAIGAWFADYDRDGDMDLYLTCAGENRLYRNAGGAKFEDVTAAAGVGGGAKVSVGATWIDADHDGDLDLYVCQFASLDGQPAANALFRNNGDGTFTDTAVEAGVEAVGARTLSVAAFDFDDDRDLDLYLVNETGGNRLLLNERMGRFRDAGESHREWVEAEHGRGLVIGDGHGDGLLDWLLVRRDAPAVLWQHTARGRFRIDAAFSAAARGLTGAEGALWADLDHDGHADIVLLDARTTTGYQHHVIMNRGAGRFESPKPIGDMRQAPQARGAVAADFDGDGSVELLIANAVGPPELWRVKGVPADRSWVKVEPIETPTSGQLLPSSASAIGMTIEVKTGRRLQAAMVSSSSGYLGSPPPVAHFGLGESPACDYIRLTWPDAVYQTELEVAPAQQWRISKVTRKPSSCPILFSWDGKRFAYVTDFLGVGGVGFFISPNVYAPSDPTEAVRIDPSLIQPRNGRYLLRIAEPLEEVTYLDELRLEVVDHPMDWQVYPDERFTGTPPWPTGRATAVVASDKVFPRAARDDEGRDVLDRLRHVDRRYVEPPVDHRFVGFAREHWVELDFGDQAKSLDADLPLMLYLYGWVEYTYSHVNYAAWQAGLAMKSPRLEVPDGEGGWRVAMAEMGFPAGLPRMMVVPLDAETAAAIRDTGRLRIATNMEVFWDQAFMAADVAGEPMRSHTLRPEVADLRMLGYPREYSPDGANPTEYDYYRLDAGIAFKNMRGAYTRFGDVRQLLAEVDDRFVVMGRGEEIVLEFDAAGLPPLPEGWARTVILHADGYCKDMDLYTAYPDTVEPLPFRGMDNYPPTTPYPNEADRLLYLRQWNTRIVR